MKLFKRSLIKLNENKAYIAIYSLLFLFYITILPKDGHGWDTQCWKEWTRYSFENGLSNIYKSWTDYLPLYHYVLWIFGHFQGSVEHIEQNIYLLKAFTVAIEFIGGFYLVKLISLKIENQNERFTLSLFYFLNIAIFYNSLIWGQVDGILATLLFISIYYAIKEKIMLVLVFFILAINFKLQAIIFLPVIGLVILPTIVKRFNFYLLLKWVGIIILLQTLILLPFILVGDLGRIANVIFGSFGKFPVVSMNAYNFWFWFFKGDLMQIQDSKEFLNITLKHWGLILFLITSFIALFPLLKNAFDIILKRNNPPFSLEKILIVSSIIPLLFFFFNTQMHERYSHPAVIFVIAYSIISRNSAPAIIICIAYLLNLEDVYRFLKLNDYNAFYFKRHFIAIIYFIGILSLYASLSGYELNRLWESKSK